MLIKYIARYKNPEICKVKVFEEFKNHIHLSNGVGIRKKPNFFSIHNSFEEAKRALLNRLVAKIHKHESKVDSYQNLLVKVNDIIEEDIK